MTSTLAWIDHDARAQDRAKRILALFQERGTVDQLGLGGVRDSFADLFFPGTSTIQTRLRYFLLVPWIYRRLEEDGVPSNRFAAEARERELSLVGPLLSAEEEGVFGRTAGGDLKRLPSEVYWAGLRSWGIRRFDASLAQYHRGVDELYRRRKRAGRDHVEDEGDEHPEVTWHAELPPAPPDLLSAASLSLTRDEAEFLVDRIATEHPESLLAWLALHPATVDTRFVWQHPSIDEMSPAQREDLRQARLFSEAMAGAPILYNRMLAELLESEALVEEYRQKHAEWIASVDLDEIAGWDLGDLFQTARRQRRHNITVQAEEFIRAWVGALRALGVDLQESKEVQQLIHRRERALKRSRSLFDNRRAREERYRGGLGVGRLDYRWGNVRVLLADLYAGLVA